MEAVLKKVLKMVTPSENERWKFYAVLEKILKAADDVITPLGLEKTIAGSFTRDTWLADKKEMDLFIMFDVSYSREDLEKMGLDIGRKIIIKLGGKYEIAYAEHPYVRGNVNGFSVDIVPCYKVESASKIKSAVDRTPFHNKYILENLKPGMAGDVRLLKQFCKAMDVYGSDVRTLGFSGYLCELLIIKYGNFKNLINSARKWKYQTFIDLEKHCHFVFPKKQFKDQPLMVIDPTDPKRNVAAVLSEENFTKFVNTCKKFIQKPSLKFFEVKGEPIKISEMKNYLKKRDTELFIVGFRRPNVVDDILWSQMRKTTIRIAKLVKENEFEIFKHEVWGDAEGAYLLFEMKRQSLAGLVKIIGPPITSDKHSVEFKKKYKDACVYVENGRWITKVKRKYMNAEKLLKDFLGRRRSTLINEGVRSHVADGIAMGFRIMKTSHMEKLIRENKEFAIFLKKYFERGL